MLISGSIAVCIWWVLFKTKNERESYKEKHSWVPKQMIIFITVTTVHEVANIFALCNVVGGPCKLIFKWVLVFTLISFTTEAFVTDNIFRSLQMQ